MRRQGWAAAAGSIAVLAWAVGNARAETLGEAIALAYQTNPTLQAERAQLRATDEEYAQAQAGLRPTIGVSGSYTYQNGDISETGAPDFKLSGGGETGTISVTQPLYTGGLASAKIDAAHADILAERETLRRTEIGVLQNVIGSYLDVRRDQEQLRISQDNVNVLQHQLDETDARFEAGQLTRTDVAQSQARLALGRSQLAAALSTLAQARAAYAAVVGQNPGELAAEPPIAALLPPSVDAAFDAAEARNPQLRGAMDAELAAAARLAEAKAQRRPTVAVTGQYGYVAQTQGVSAGGFNQSVGLFESQLGGTISAQVNIPISNGGLYASDIRQAAEQDNVRRIQIEGARRDVLQQVSQAWNQLLGARASLTADEEQVKSDTVAYEGVRQEQKVGLRTILDVLNAQQELETSQLQLVSARHDEYVAAAAVLAATGALEAGALIPDTPRYDPEANFDRVRHAPGWVPWEGAVHAIDRAAGPAPTPMPPPSPPGEVVKTATP
ncbi:MAG TPA: TolC family outer membrane protein [Caulobacteraceae bacterium]|nr:TolC family outer membrane protein [Caulobacteraceae bacterium]